MLTRLSIKNFRLLRDVTIDVEPGKPIVLIGPNSSGKSSVIQVLDLLGRCAREGLEEAFRAFDGSRLLVTAGLGNGESARLEVVADLSDDDAATAEDYFAKKYLLQYGMQFRSDRVTAESLHSILDGQAASEVMSRTNSALWIQNSQTQAKDTLLAATGKLSFELIRQHSFYASLEAIKRTLAAVTVYDGFLTTPLWTRDVREGRLSSFGGAVVEPCPRIDRRGLDLINALHYLQSSHPDEWDELERSFKSEFPFVQRLEFPADPAGGRIGLGWRDRRYPGVRMLGDQMSEGMATYLCLLAAILSPYRATAIAFDEPERNLHPSALRRLVYLMERLSERTAVFVATHSDRFLDYLADPAASIRVCEPSEQGVSLRRLDGPALDAWRADYTLSELRERGHLDATNTGALDP